MGPHRHSIKQIVVIVLVLLEYPDVLEDLGFNLHPVIVANGILSKEIKDDKVRRFESNMFTAKRTTTDGVGFVFALLITSTKGEFVDEIHSRSTLAISHDFRPQIDLIVRSDAIDVILHNKCKRRI